MPFFCTKSDNAVLKCSTYDCNSCLECAAGCLTLLLLDQYREADDIGSYRLPRASWGWGDSVPRSLGIVLDCERSPKRQPSPSFTSLALETLAEIWPGFANMGLGTNLDPMRMGLNYLLNRETADGRIDWVHWAGALTSHEVTGTLRHSALGATALLAYAAESPELMERAKTAVRFVLHELDRAPWSRIAPQELVPVTMGAVRRVLWSFVDSETVDCETRQLCIRAIGRHDRQMTQYIRGVVTGTQAADWANRSSWAALRDPEEYLDRSTGKDSMPEGVMEFLLWSPTNDNSSIAALERVVDLAIQRDAGNGVTLYGYPAPDLGSNVMLLSIIVSSAIDGRWSAKLGEKLTEIASKSRESIVRDFWAHKQQRRMYLQHWMWLLRSLMSCQRVKAMLTGINARRIDQKIGSLRSGSPHLYRPVESSILQDVYDIARWCVSSPYRDESHRTTDLV